MKPLRSCLLISALSWSAALAVDYPLQAVPFTDVQITGGVLQQRQSVNNAVTLPFAVEQCVTSKRLENFALAAETMERRAAGNSDFQHRPVTNYPFDDSDIYKVIEGAAFCLSVEKKQAIRERLDGFIQQVGHAQEPDGYLYTFRTMHPDSPAHDWVGDRRWEKVADLSHELYNLGHLYEAATAYYQATGSRTLLDISLRTAELLFQEFGDGENVATPGHQVIEMGLVKLYRQTGDRRWLDLAKLFLESRGKNPDNPRPAYSQDHLPVVDQTEAVGHAVRANYLYSGMADVAALTGDQGYLDAVNKIWDNVVGRKLHLTGGCGARHAGEAYGNDYELPNVCYNETCAAVSFLFWNQRMFLMTGDSKYTDVLERTLYNGALSGVSLSGDRFFYPNTLRYDGKTKNNHGFAGRAPWFGCACCPPNIMRTIASLGGYFYAVRDRDLYVNLYAQSEATASIDGQPVRLTQSTDYPWGGRIKLRVDPAEPREFCLRMRIPGWVEGRPLPSDLYAYEDATPAVWSAKLNGESLPSQSEGGYLVIQREWKPGDEITLDLPMPVRRVVGNPKVAATRGMVALERGPVVYAFEGVDNEDEVFHVGIPDDAVVTHSYEPDLLDGVVTLEVENAQRALGGETERVRLKAIPYATWNNRGLSQMVVWLPREVSESITSTSNLIAKGAEVSASFAREGMSLEPLSDSLMPENATDGFTGNFDFWPHKGSVEWVAYRFKNPQKINSVTVNWFDDTGTGECRLPVSWRVLYLDRAGEWQEVDAIDDYAIRKREPIKVRFQPVTSTDLKLEVQLPDGFSAGLHEWVVE